MDLTQIVAIVGYVYLGLQAVRLVLQGIKAILNLIPGDQGEATIDKIEGWISIIENFLGKFVPVNTKKTEDK